MKNTIISELQKCNDKIVLKNVLHLLQRSNIGVKKYGVTLQENDLKLSDRINHAREESLDFANYLTKIESINKHNSFRGFDIGDEVSCYLVDNIGFIDNNTIPEKRIVEKFLYEGLTANDNNKLYFISGGNVYLAY